MERPGPNSEKEAAILAENLITSLMDSELPSYFDCPETINLSNHRLAKLLTTLRHTADTKMVNLLKKVRKSPEVRGLSALEVRQQTDDFWWLEYYQSVYNHKNRWFVTDIRQGGIATSEIQSKRLGDPHNSKRRIFFHTHPSDSTFSSPDLHHFLLGMDADKVLGTKAEIVYAAITLQFVLTDYHVYMCFPTGETEVPDFAQALSDGLFPAEFMQQLMPTEFERVWLELILKYGYEKLQPFLGSKLYTHESLFPEEVNDLGTNLINLAHTLEICQKYALKFYVADRGSFIFREINNVEDVYRDILV